MKELPNTLHELLGLAIKDMEALMGTEDNAFDMGAWIYMSKYGNLCYVCMAGAVMLNTLKIKKPPRGQDIKLEPFKRPLRFKIYAIDNMRKGKFKEAFLHLYNEMVLDDAGVLDKINLNKINNEYKKDNEKNDGVIGLYPQEYLHLFKKYQRKLKEANL